MSPKHCPVCGKFMKRVNSRRWDKKWRCEDCGIHEYKGERYISEWFPLMIEEN